MRKKLGRFKYNPIGKFKVILSGLYVAVITDFSVAYKLVISIVVLVISFVFRQRLDINIILLTTGLMLTAELFNSSIELLCDFVQDQQDERIKVIKDIAAAATGISIFVWAIILILEIDHFFQLTS